MFMKNLGNLNLGVTWMPNFAWPNSYEVKNGMTLRDGKVTRLLRYQVVKDRLKTKERRVIIKEKRLTDEYNKKTNLISIVFICIKLYWQDFFRKSKYKPCHQIFWYQDQGQLDFENKCTDLVVNFREKMLRDNEIRWNG